MYIYIYIYIYICVCVLCVCDRYPNVSVIAFFSYHIAYRDLCKVGNHIHKLTTTYTN